MRALAADANRRSFGVWEEQTIDSEALGRTEARWLVMLVGNTNSC